MVASQKVKLPPRDPAGPSAYPGEAKAGPLAGVCTPVFMAALVTVATR